MVRTKDKDKDKVGEQILCILFEVEVTRKSLKCED
jgi:hypothetical protein